MTQAAPDEGFVDVLASGVHDTKNRLFDALSRIDAVRRNLPSSDTGASEAASLLDEAHVAIEQSADRLAQILSVYRLVRRENPVVLLPTPLSELAEYVRLRARSEWHGKAELVIEPVPEDLWIMDRELVADCLVNALLNASRHAVAKVTLTMKIESDWLAIDVADDGPGYPDGILAGEAPAGSIGLFLADRIAALHARNDRRGTLSLMNAPAGGALFRLLLP
jgi:signal transduction histidine kinase